MEGIPVLCRDELTEMGKDALIEAYLSLKDRFLEQMAVDAEKDRLIKTLSERLNLHNAKQFGKSTETSVSLSGGHCAGGEDISARERSRVPDSLRDTKNPLNKERPKRKPGCAARIKDGLPVRHVDVTIPPETLKELFGSHRWRELPEQSYDILRYRKACLYIERRHIHVYTADGKIVRAGKADKMSPKSLASPEVLAGILDAKFVMGIPVYRLEQQFARDGGQLARQTIYEWIIRYCLEYFEVFVMRMAQLMLESGHIQADETPVTVKDERPDGEAHSQCYFWVFSTSELWSGERIVVFQYESSRNTEVLREFLRGYSGTLTCDAYTCCQTFEKEQEGCVTVTGCLTKDFSDRNAAAGTSG